MIMDIKNVFDNPEDRNYLAFEVLEEILTFFLWIIRPENSSTQNFNHFSFQDSYNHKLRLEYYWPKYSNSNPNEYRGARVKLWLFGTELFPRITEKIKKEFPLVKEMELQYIIKYFADICDQFVFDPITHRPIQESFRNDLEDSIPSEPKPNIKLIL